MKWTTPMVVRIKIKFEMDGFSIWDAIKMRIMGSYNSARLLNVILEKIKNA